jgi:hypothetical protein
MRRHLRLSAACGARVGAAESFVSFIPLFDSPALSAFVVVLQVGAPCSSACGTACTPLAWTGFATLSRHAHNEPNCFSDRSGVMVYNQFRNRCQVWRAIQHVETAHSRRTIVFELAEKEGHRVMPHQDQRIECELSGTAIGAVQQTNQAGCNPFRL